MLFRDREFHHTHVHNLFLVFGSYFFSFQRKQAARRSDARIVGKPSRIVTHSVHAMKRRKKEDSSSSFASSFVFQWCFRKFLLGFVVIFRYTWITLKYFVRRDDRAKKAIKKTLERRVKIEWLSGSEWVLCSILCCVLLFILLHRDVISLLVRRLTSRMSLRRHY